MHCTGNDCENSGESPNHSRVDDEELLLLEPHQRARYPFDAQPVIHRYNVKILLMTLIFTFIIYYII